MVGTVHPSGIWPKNGAQPGDALFLTKPLGTGLVLHGVKRGLGGDAELAGAVAWMRTLNREAADALRPFEPNAVTDVTGFGLLGHAHEMAERSGVELRLEPARWPALDGALEVARAGERTGGDPRNREFAAAHVDAGDASDELLALGYDPQTAGGLLVSLPADRSPHARGGVRLARALSPADRQCRRGRGRHASLSPCTSSRRSSPVSAGSRSRRPHSGGSRSRRR